MASSSAPPRNRLRYLAVALAAAGALVVWGRCAHRPTTDAPSAVQLVDRFRADMVERRRPTRTVARTEWSFASPAAGFTWAAGPGVSGLEVRDGRLVGVASGERPVVELLAPQGAGGEDVLHAIEVRMGASGGSTLQVNTLGADGPPAAAFGTPLAPNGFAAPLLGPEEQTYSFPLASSFGVAAQIERTRVRRVILRPSDVAGARFTIAGVRLVYRREHLATIPSGIGWRGLGEVWRESLVTRPGELVRMPMSLPARPLLDLDLGMLGELPLAFRVAVKHAGEEHAVLQHTLTTPDRWHADPVALDRWAGEDVELVLRADPAPEAGEGNVRGAEEALAFWGSPVVRSRQGGAAAPAARVPQGVIVIVADTLRRDHLDAWGYERPTAPVLRRLAAEGARFEDAVAQAVWTKVSVPSILTSLYPSTHGIVDFTDRLPATATTLAEAYRAAGYATFATSAIPFTGQLTNLHQGFEVLHESRSFVPPEAEQRMKSARDYVGRLLSFVEGHREVPFFALLHVGDPHAPYRPFAPYDRWWVEPGDLGWFRDAEEQVRQQIAPQSPRRRVAAANRDELRRAGVDVERFVRFGVGWYDGSIRAMDAEIGRLIDRLEHLGLGERVVLAFVSDHGEEFLEHGSHWHGLNVYGENANVPMVLWGPPFVPRGVRIAPTVQLLDLMPTLLELSGIRPVPGTQGRSLLPLLRAGDGQRPVGWRDLPAFVERRQRASESGAEGIRTGFAMVKGGWKLVRHVPAPAGGAEYELYDHRADPLDRRDLAALHPQRVRELAAELEAWRLWAEKQRLAAGQAAEVDAAELERLRSLGYVN